MSLFERRDQTCHSGNLDWLPSFPFQSKFNGSTTIQFKEKTTTHQVAVLQQVWKRLKNAEVQTIHQIMDATGLQFDSVCEVLYDYAELPDFIQLLQDKGCLDDVPFDASEMEMGNQVLLLTKKGFAWGDFDEEPINQVLELL